MTEREETGSRPQVGISLLVVREFDDRPYVLLGQRKGSHGEGEWGTPGGHLEHGETFEQGALGELMEECGDEIQVTRPRLLRVTNMLDYMPKHYVDIGMLSFWKSGDPKLMEPEKCSGWTWHPADGLPSPLFAVVWSLTTAYLTGEHNFH